MRPGSWVVVPPNKEHYIHVFNSVEPVINLDIFTPRPAGVHGVVLELPQRAEEERQVRPPLAERRKRVRL